MGHLLNSGEVGNIGLEHLKQIRSKTIGKWDSKLGFLEGLKGHVKENIAQLYENQASSSIKRSYECKLIRFFRNCSIPYRKKGILKIIG